MSLGVPRYSACQNVPLAVCFSVGLRSGLPLPPPLPDCPPPPLPSYPGGCGGLPGGFLVVLF